MQEPRSFAISTMHTKFKQYNSGKQYILDVGNSLVLANMVS